MGNSLRKLCSSSEPEIDVEIDCGVGVNPFKRIPLPSPHGSAFILTLCARYTQSAQLSDDRVEYIFTGDAVIALCASRPGKYLSAGDDKCGQ